MRGKFESVAASGSSHMIAIHEELITQLNIWLADEGLIASESTLEKPLVSRALGSWSRQEAIDAAWRANSLGVILWALSLFDRLPPWDTPVTPQETIKPEDGTDLNEIVSLAATAAYRNGDITETIKDDFPAFGKAYSDLSQEEFAAATSIATERHYALNWLCGYAEDWDKVPTET